MSWTRVLVVFLLTTFLILTFLSVAENAAVRRDSKEGPRKDVAQQVFMPGSDASNFFKRRSRRSPRYYDEFHAEHRRASASGRRRNSEEYRNEYDRYIEEDHDEQTTRYKRIYDHIRAIHYSSYNPYYYYWYY